MKNEEIIEGNKLIAEFMGYKYYPNDSINGFKGVLKKKGKSDLLLIHDHLGQYAWSVKYHSSWDSLMPIVEKISENFDVTICSVGLWATFISRKDCDWEDKHIGDMGGHEPIVNTWKAIIQFLKWYNKQPKYKQSKYTGAQAGN